MVAEDETIPTLEAKIHEVEHRLIVEAVRLYGRGPSRHRGPKGSRQTRAVARIPVETPQSTPV